MKHNTTRRHEALAPEEENKLTPAEKRQAVDIINKALIHGGRGKHAFAWVESGDYGAKDSGHGVFFARSEKPAEGLPGALAIKRFSRHEGAERERDNLLEAKNRGFRIVEPVGDGVVPIGDMGSALVTAHIPRFTTMNQVGWQDLTLGSASYDEAATTLQSMAAFAGRLHSAGMVHNDLQIKNFGQVPSGEYVLFDAERMRFYDPYGSDTGAGSEFAGGCIDDMTKMAKSLLTRGYLAGMQPNIVQEELSNNVLAPYFDNGGSEELMEQYDTFMADVMTTHMHAPLTLHATAAGRLALQ